MQRLKREDLESYSKRDLIELTDHLMDEVDYSLYLIRNLEKRLEIALNELGSTNPIVEEIIEQIENLRKKVFGRSSERTKNFTDIFTADDNEESSSDKKNLKKKGSSKPKRKNTEARLAPETPIEEIYHYASDQVAASYGLEVWPNQFETSDLITIIPTTIKVERHHRQKYTYIDSDTGDRRFFTAPGPLKLRDGAQYSIEFVSHIAANKYAFHLPLDRQATMLQGKGLEIPTSSLQNQVDYAAFILKNGVFTPIIEYLKKRPIIEADDTTWPNLESLKTRNQDKYYLWGMKDDKAIAFNIFNARSQKVAKDFLGEQEGILLCDGHYSFESLVSDKLILAADWAHARRYFVKAAKYFPEEVGPFIALINYLFEIERDIKEKPPDEITQERNEKSKPILEEIRNLLDTVPHLKTSSLGKAIGYTRRLWDRLIVFLHHPMLPLSTNGIERAMRAPALGRKNHLGSKNFETAKNAAIWYTITETCKLNSVNSEIYISYALKTILNGQKPLMPWEYSTSLLRELRP